MFWCSVGAQKHGGLKKIHVASIASSWNSSYFLKFFLTSYSPYRLFSAFRSIWGLWKWFQMIPHTQKPGGLKKIRSLACLEAELLREDVLDLLQPIHAVLDLRVNLGPLKMVSNDSPYPKTWGLKKNQVSSLLGSRVTPRRCPWPPTARIGCSWPSGQSGASENGPKWFPIPKNLGFKKIRCLAYSEAELLHGELDHPLRPLSSIFHTIEWCSYLHPGCSELVYV